MIPAQPALYLSPKDNHTDYTTDAPLVAVKLGELGYWPIYSTASADELNGGPLPEAVKASAVAASMFGWDVPAAQAAIAYLQQQPRQGA